METLAKSMVRFDAINVINHGAKHSKTVKTLNIRTNYHDVTSFTTRKATFTSNVLAGQIWCKKVQTNRTPRPR